MTILGRYALKYWDLRECWFSEFLYLITDVALSLTSPELGNSWAGGEPRLHFSVIYFAEFITTSFQCRCSYCLSVSFSVTYIMLYCYFFLSILLLNYGKNFPEKTKVLARKYGNYPEVEHAQRYRPLTFSCLIITFYQ